MSITILFFGGLRERIGFASTTIALPAHVVTVGDLRDNLIARGEPWQALEKTRNLRVAVNHSMAVFDLVLSEGDEVAFFPPVTGG